MNKKGSEFKNI